MHMREDAKSFRAFREQGDSMPVWWVMGKDEGHSFAEKQAGRIQDFVGKASVLIRVLTCPKRRNTQELCILDRPRFV